MGDDDFRRKDRDMTKLPRRLARAALVASTALALGALLLPRRLMLTLAGIAVLASAAVALVHVGVEAHWWPSPLPGCAAPSAGGARSVEDLMSSLSENPIEPSGIPS